MLNRLRERIANCLASRSVCVLSVNASGENGSHSVWAVPVRCRSHGLEVDCLVPRWADAAFYLEQDPGVLLIFQNPDAGNLRWLQYRGRAHIQPAPDWAKLLPADVAGRQPENRFLAVRVQPSRIDLIDETEGWGVLESLEF